MYLEHFGLREAPFRITPHTEFFFAGANRGATLEALIYAITHDEGIVKVSGEVGSGKTMLCRMLLEKLPPDVETVYLANPSLSAADIHHAIADDQDFFLAFLIEPPVSRVLINVLDANVIVPLHFEAPVVLIGTPERSHDRTQHDPHVAAHGKAFDDLFVPLQ